MRSLTRVRSKSWSSQSAKARGERWSHGLRHGFLRSLQEITSHKDLRSPGAPRSEKNPKNKKQVVLESTLVSEFYSLSLTCVPDILPQVTTSDLTKSFHTRLFTEPSGYQCHALDVPERWARYISLLLRQPSLRHFITAMETRLACQRTKFLFRIYPDNPGLSCTSRSLT